MSMTMSQHANSSNELKNTYSEVRKQNIAGKWEELSKDFQEYTNKVNGFMALVPSLLIECNIFFQMRLLQDKYPDVLPQKTVS